MLGINADDLYAEIARRFDPTIDDANLPGIADDLLTFQIIPCRREIAWRNAERLASAATPEQRTQVAGSIEAYAASQAAVEAGSIRFSDRDLRDRVRLGSRSWAQR